MEEENLYQEMFYASAVSAWHLDTREAIKIYTVLRERGVSDIIGYAEENPGFVHEALAATRVIDVNDETVRLFGAQNRSDIIGKSVAPFWITGNYATFLGCVQCTFDGMLTFRSETKLQTLDGRQIDVLFTKSESLRLQNTGEALLSIVDLTDRVKAQDMLAKAQANLAHSARLSLLGELTASIAHEVNQPMAAITSFGAAGLRWLDRQQPDVGGARSSVVQMMDAARRASGVIDRVRAMVTPAALAKQRLSLNQLIREAMVFVAPELSKLGAEHAFRLTENLPSLVGDPIQLQQVMMNVALNACQAMEHSPVRRLLIRTSMANSDCLKLELEDTGPGIAEDHLDQLFESFFTTKRDGMGIGLAICRSIAEAHGGSINLSNLQGGGARATLLLPAGL